MLPQGSPFVPHFNTSHVTVYHRVTELLLHQKSHFNTSHVTVYLISTTFLYK